MPICNVGFYVENKCEQHFPLISNNSNPNLPSSTERLPPNLPPSMLKRTARKSSEIKNPNRQMSLIVRQIRQIQRNHWSLNFWPIIPNVICLDHLRSILKGFSTTSVVEKDNVCFIFNPKINFNFVNE